MSKKLKYLEGKRFCVVFMKAAGDSSETVRLRVLHGRASIDAKGILAVEHSGGSFQLPSSCYNNILPSDGTEVLKDAEYYVICRVDGMEL